MKRVGILHDNISGNMGDQAIGISVRTMLAEMGIDYEELVPGRFNAADYRTIIIGGGYLLQPSPNFFYDKFRVPGAHILNSCGIVDSPDDLQYLDDYLYVTVRSRGDRDKLSYLTRDVDVVPCTTMLLRDLPQFDLKIEKPSIGVHVWGGTIDEEPLVQYLSGLPFHIYFIPITHYNRDFRYLERLSRKLLNSALLPIMRPEEIFTVIGALDYFICTSLHGAIFAYVHNVPFLLYDSQDKQRFFMEDRKLDNYLFRDFSDLRTRFEDLLNSRPDYSALLDHDFKTLHEHRLRIEDLLLKTAPTEGIQSVVARRKSQIEEQRAIVQQRNFQIHHLQSQVDALLAQTKQQLTQIRSLEASIQERVAQIDGLESHIEQIQHSIEQIQHSIPIQLAGRYQRMVDRVLPPGTHRRGLYEVWLSGLRAIVTEGWKSFFRKANSCFWRRCRSLFGLPSLVAAKMRYYHILVCTGVRVIRNEGWRSFWHRFRRWQRQQQSDKRRGKPTTLPPAMADDWGDYWLLTQRIAQARKNHLESFSPRPVSLISIPEGNLATHVRSLRLPSLDHPQVSIVIPVYNHDKLTVECLSSLVAHTPDIPYEVILVDDGSAGSTEDLLSNIQNITYLRNPQNLGFSPSCNRGAEKARGELLLILNNDVQVTRGWLPPLIDTFSKHDSVGAVSPKILFPNGRLQEAGARIKWDAYSHLIGFWDDPELPRYNYARDVDYCSGVCLMLKTEVFRTLGGFDPVFAPAYCEDSDLCFRLREMGKRVLYNPNSAVIHHLSSTTKSDSVYKLQLAVKNGQKLADRWQKQIDANNGLRLIAFYLPQYHRIPENDNWWGEGFTEWTNVKKARPNFAGHYQPHVPGELGYYDLEDERIMDRQAEMAMQYGIHGFCFYYYWFAGRRLLDMPLERMLETGRPDIPFCLCWANENWTRTWDGRDDSILIAQEHSDEDDRAVIRDLMRYMRHPNYIKVNGKPILLVYRVSLFPDIKRTTEIWRDLCRREGTGEIYLAMVESFEQAHSNRRPSEYGFDASVEFPPHEMIAPIRAPGRLTNPSYEGIISDYRQIVLRYAEKPMPAYTRFRAVMPGWDNTARHQDRPYIFAHSSPGAYQAWLEAVLELTLEQNFGDERIVFISAWNEWAEGNHLEPDQRFGHGFLEATRNAIDRALLRNDYP